MATTESTPAPAVNGAAKKRVTRPNKEAFQTKLGELETALRQKEAALEKARNAVKNVKTGGAKNEGREKLHKELSEARSVQNELKIARGKVQEQVKVLEAGISKKISDLQASRGKANFKSVDEIDKRISQLETQVESGSLRLVDEKRNLSEISNLNKLRKSFGGFSAAQATIDADKEKVAELRKTNSDGEYKKIGAKIGEIMKELDALKEADQAAYKSRSHLFDARTAATKARDETRDALHKLKDDYYGGLRAFNEQYKAEEAARIEREKAEKKAAEKGKKLQEAQSKLEAAQAPAFAAHVEVAQNLLAHFDPEYKKEAAVTSLLKSNDSLNSKRAARTIAIPEGAKVLQKQEEDMFAGSSKKGNKNKKAKDDGKLKLNLSIIEDLSFLNIPIPTSKDDVSNTVLKLKEKIEFYKTNEERVTAEKVERAQADLDKIKASLEAEEAEEPAAVEEKPETETAPAVEASA